MEQHDTQGLAIIPFLDGDSKHPTIYDAVGVEPVINCRGTFTILGGSVERPEVIRAMQAASGYFVQYDELAQGVGKQLAKLTGAEWGLIASGCAAGIKHVTTACVTGGNPEKLIRVPDLRGFEKTQVIIPRYSRNAYDHAVRNVGVEIIMVDTPDELEHAMNEGTAMIYLVTGEHSAPGQPLSLEKIAHISRPFNIPILADAAAENLTIPPIHLEQGATVVAYSGGKAICGPQCAGIVLGKKDLLQSAWQSSSPHHGPGRDNKVGKEEIMGMVAAVEAWITRDHENEWKKWLTTLNEIARRVSENAAVSWEVLEPEGLINRAPSLVISWKPDQLHITGNEIAENFAQTSPRIAIGSFDRDGHSSISINPSQMQPGNKNVVIERLCETLNTKRCKRLTDLKDATADVDGEWAVTVNYFTSTSNHRWNLRQDGNWIEGRHESDQSIQDICGTVEGSSVTLRSVFNQPGDSIDFIFSGTVTNSTIEGSIHLGEYLSATFTAIHHPEIHVRQRINVPSGPPLAT